MLRGKQETQKFRFKDRFLAFTQKVEQMLTKRNQCILFLLTLIVAAAATLDAAGNFFPKPVSIMLYVLAAAGFMLTCTLWVKAVLIFAASVVLPFTKSNRIANALITDNRLRIVLTTLPGMGLNLIYAVFNGVIGITARSAWYGSLSAYYLLLCIMRLLSVTYAKQIYIKKEPAENIKKELAENTKKESAENIKKEPAENAKKEMRETAKEEPAESTKKELAENLADRELKVYLNCGRMLSVSSIALGGAVIMLVLGDGGKSYPGLLIYAAAAYTFYKLTKSIINKVKVRKEKSLLLTTLQNISYSDAFVSLLSLQTALFAAFGQDAGEFVPIMNTLTGAGVCLMILGLGISMVYHAKKLQKKA